MSTNVSKLYIQCCIITLLIDLMTLYHLCYSEQGLAFSTDLFQVFLKFCIICIIIYIICILVLSLQSLLSIPIEI